MPTDSYLTVEDLNYLISLCESILAIPRQSRSIENSLYHQVVAELYMCKRSFTASVNRSDIVMFDVTGVLSSVRGSLNLIDDLLTIFTQMRMGIGN